MIGIFRTDSGTGQKLSWLGTPAIRPIAPDLRIYDVNSATLSVERIALGPHSPIIQAPVTWFGCSFPDVERTGILVSFHTVQPSGIPISHYTKFGELSPDGLFYGNTYTTLYSEEPQDHVPVGIIKLASGALIAAFYSLILDGAKVRYSFHYRTTPQTGSVWKAPVSVSLDFSASADTDQSCALIQHWDHTIYFFRHLTNDGAIGSINLVENLALGTVEINTDSTKIPNSNFISTANTLPPFATSPKLRATLDVYRQGIILAYQTSIGATTNNRARMAFCFIASDATKTFVQMTDKYVLNSGEFEIGSKADVGTVWFAGECLNDAGAATPVQVGTYVNPYWTFTDTGTIQNPIYPVRDDFGSAFGSGTVSGFGYLVSGNIYFKSFNDNYPPSTSGTSDWVSSMIGNTLARAISTALDSFGNMYVVGNSSYPVNFGTDVNGNNITINPPGTGLFTNWIAKYNSDGVLIWVKSFQNVLFAASSSPVSPVSQSVCVDSANNAIFCGSFCRTADFSGAYAVSGPFVKTALDPYQNNSPDMFVAKYNSAGVIQWVRTFGGDSTDLGIGASICPDGSSIIFAGKMASRTVNQVASPINFGPDPLGNPINLTTLSSGDLVLCKLSGAGVSQWAVNYGGDVNLVPPNIPSVQTTSIAIDSSGDILVTGSYNNGKINLGGGIITGQGTSGSIFVAKYSATGAYQWGFSIGGSNYDKGTGITTHPVSKNVIVYGDFLSTANFDGGQTVNGSTRTGKGPWVAAYTSSGTFLWVLPFGTDYSEIPGGVAVDSSGYLTVTGTKGSDWDYHTFAPSRYVLGQRVDHNVGFFLVAFTLAGNDPPYFLWLKTPDKSISPGGGVGFALALTPQKIILAGVSQYGNMDVGGHFAYSNSVGISGFLAKISR